MRCLPAFVLALLVMAGVEFTARGDSLAFTLPPPRGEKDAQFISRWLMSFRSAISRV
jgi:hypothetical protein